MAKQNPTYNLLDLVKVLKGDKHYFNSDMWSIKDRAKNMAKHFENGEIRYSKNDDLNMKRLSELGRLARERQNEKGDLGKKKVTNLRTAIADNLRAIYRVNRPIYDANQLYGMLVSGDSDDFYEVYDSSISKMNERTERLDNVAELVRKGRCYFNGLPGSPW